MEETICISKKEYQKLIKYKESTISENIFNFDEVFGIGNGKLKAQEVKNMLRKEW